MSAHARAMSHPPPPPPLLTNELSRRTAVLGLRLWVLVGIAIGAAFLLLLLALVTVHLAAAARRRRPGKKKMAAPALSSPSPATTIPPVSKEIQEVAVHVGSLRHYLEMGTAFLKDNNKESAQQDGGDSLCGSVAHGSQRVHIEAGKGRRMVAHADGPGPVVVGPPASDAAPPSAHEVSQLGWGHWYTLRELDEATAGFAPERVVGEGGYGIVYQGVFADGHQVAVKNLLNDTGQAEREFTVEVEAIGRVRHKNLVRLLGYCNEGAHRILVYEYVDNGNLEQWLHGDVGPLSPLSWDTRMNIVLGTAKGITYLHDGLEPKVVHRDIKSSNILLDKRWNPKVSDFGLAKLLGSDSNYVTTRVMGTFGYVAPEYASTGMLNERSDVYSFGVLIMEIISGRSPVDYARPPGEVNLVEWLKKMVSNRDYEAVLDPKLPEKPSSKALKKALLVALRCVDPDSQKRPKMGHAIHMLEVDDFPYRDDRRTLRPCQGSPLEKARVPRKPLTESGHSSCYEGNSSTAATTPSRFRES
ncbi:probable serine/threonine-protein kinase At1g01540 isoform X2 [Brachypodium distachyon]|uniref:probable serine/threonine-protein kinase At1g01540 isoform X2 n=1 Tax=Brachypodium distachyon TaxID=15368 RepID=UPI0001C725EC|nr:probable serine/threonine-protein kinase At1g01540 isoform X2 [Brachypodium distachyon]|eukprot:XP_014753519.1 probable serine/threonine-protein kinase At1g01540 isoform X2 [Brachypodium distachyon]